MSKHRKAWWEEHEAQKAKEFARLKAIPKSPHALALEKERAERIEVLCGEIRGLPSYMLHCEAGKIQELCNLARFFEAAQDHGDALRAHFAKFEKSYGKDAERKQIWEYIRIDNDRINYAASSAIRVISNQPI